MKKVKYIAPFIASVIMLAACNNAETEEDSKMDELVAGYVTYADEDFYTAWQDSDFTKIELKEDSATADGAGGVVIEEGNIEIRTSGTYVLEGSLENGQIIINAEDKGTVRLVLNGVSITSTTGSVIHVKQSDQTVISLEEGTENILEDAEEYIFEEGEDEPSAAIFSKDDLTINGSGKLVVQANYKDGIAGRDDVLVTGGIIEIHAIDDGLVGRDLLALRDAKVKIEAGGDGVKSSNDEDEQKGHIVLQSGSLDIVAGSDGIQSERDVLVVDGEYTITAGGGSPETVEANQEVGGAGGAMPGGNAPDIAGGGPMNVLNPSQIQQYLSGAITKEELLESIEDSGLPEGMTIEDVKSMLDQMEEGGQPQGGQRMEPPTDGEGGFDPSQMPPTGDNGMAPPVDGNTGEESSQSTESSTEEETDDSVSTKGIKAVNLVQIEGGTFTVDSNEDAIHSNGNVVIQGGAMTVHTGDDGIHADYDVLISDGVVQIEKSYEGIEGVNITLKDGDVSVVAADDGVNINSGSSEVRMFDGAEPDTTTEEESGIPSEGEEGLLLIEGGYLYVNANGDGLDSNSSIKMTDGTVVVYGSTNGGDSSIDYDGTFTVEGGTLIAAGSSGMAMGISDTSTQPAIMMTFTDIQSAGTVVSLSSDEKEILASVAPEKDFQALLISTPKLEQEADYTLSFGGTVEAEMKDGIALDAGPMKDEKGTVSFTLPKQIMTYINESGITENGGNGGLTMPGRGPDGQVFPGGRGMMESQDGK